MAKIWVFDEATALTEAAAQRFQELSMEAVRARGAFHVALSGGGTPQALYQRLASADYVNEIDWDRVHVYFGDERCVAPDHPDSNYRMAAQALLNRVPLPPEQIHRIEAETPSPQAGARAYAEVLLRHLPRRGQGLPQFDLVLLGMGEDGHTASLFPGTPLVQETERLVGAVYVEKLGAWRISITFPVINAARNVLVLVAGAGKAARIGEIFTLDEVRYPIQKVAGNGEVEWYLDAAAARELPEELRR